MNEKLQYAEMLDIPVSTCNITYKPKKKRKFIKERHPKTKNVENVKQELVDKINEEIDSETPSQVSEIVEEYSQFADDLINTENISNSATITKKPKKGRSKLVAFELALVCALVATICLTSAFIENSAINVFFRNVFKSEAVAPSDLRVYTDFKPTAPIMESDKITLTGGVMSLTTEGSVYAPCNGKITSITADESGTFDIEVAHSDNFSTVFSGIDYVYGEVGDKVYSTIPLGYVESLDAKVCFMSNSGLVTGYTILDGNVVWGV